MVALLSKQKNPPEYFCGGILVASNKVLTAAHCIWDKGQPAKMLANDVIVKLGAYDLADPYESHTFITTPAEIIIHKRWNASSDRFNDDIAVILLDENISYSKFIKPICIADIEEVREATQGLAVGWGKSEDETNDIESIPRQAQLPITGDGPCYRETIELARIAAKNSFCAGSMKSRVCIGKLITVHRLDKIIHESFLSAGDSGNGFFIFHNGRYYLKGIVSASIVNPNGRPCDATHHALFTEILKYLDWIDIPSRKVENGVEEEVKCGVMSESAGLVQGGRISSRETFPWIVSIFVEDFGKFSHFGSGSLISSKHVLATATSVALRDKATNKMVAVEKSRVKLIFGSLKFDEITSDSVEVDGDGIAEILVHPNAHGSLPRTANIAIISLKNRLHKTNFVSPVCLWQESSESIGSASYGVGYGVDETGSYSGIRKHVKMLITSDLYCIHHYRNVMTTASHSKYFCAQSDGTATTCSNDDPLYIKINGTWFIRGLLNAFSYFADGTCDAQKPILYEDIALFQDWIATNSRDVEAS